MTVGRRAGPDELEHLSDLGHLAAAVSHSVINAFSAVVSNAELVRSHARDPNSDPAELTVLGAAIIENALNAAQIPRRLIDWTRRFTSPGFEPGTASPLIDLNEVVRSVVSARSSALGPSISWTLNLVPVPLVRGNAEQLRSMIEHLIENAREAMPGGIGTITFTTRATARNWVVLEVRDTGAGMDGDVIKHAAEPFFTTKPGRSGTGLTIAHGIWRRHHGTLAIESQPGEGTLMRLSVEAPPPPPSLQQGPAVGRSAPRPVETMQGERTPPAPTGAAGPAVPAGASGPAAGTPAAMGALAHGELEPPPRSRPLEKSVPEADSGPVAASVEELSDKNEIHARPVPGDH